MNETGTRTEQMGVVTTQRSGEMAVAAMAAKAKAQVEARYVIAYNRPRSINQARSDILSACSRPAFAESARYRKPVGGKYVDGRWQDNFIEGFSIRFAEEAIKAMKNINVESTTIYEDEQKRTVNVTVCDLESNLTYGKEVTVDKTVERRKLRDGQEAISSRTNSAGDKVFIVRATEDEIANKIAAQESKIIRNCGLRLVPTDILEEADAAIDKALESGVKADPKGATKKIVDNFSTIGVPATELEKYLKHPLESISPKELNELRAIFAAIRDGQTAWIDYLGESAKTKPNIEDPKGKTATKTKTVEPEKAADKPPIETTTKPVNPPTAPAEPHNPDDGDLNPKTATATAQATPTAVANPNPFTQEKPENATLKYKLTPAMLTKLTDLGVPMEGFERYVAQRGIEKEFTENPEKACADLLGNDRMLSKMKTIYGLK